MRAAVLHGREDVRVEEAPEYPLKPGEVRVKIGAALTCGTDLKVYKRGYHAKMIVPPAVFGHELAGEIAEIHPDTQGWSRGERVVVANSAPCGDCFFCQHGQENLCDDLLFLNGAYAESIVVPARIVEKNMLRLAPSTAFKDAALTEPLACVVQGIRDTSLQESQRILILGAGPIGLMFAALAVNANCVVTVAGRGESRLRKAESLGAARVVDVGSAKDIAEPLKAVRPEGWDIVIEAIGKPETWEAALKLVRKGGTINFFGGCPSGTTVQMDTGLIHYSNLKLLASFHHTPGAIREAFSYIQEGVIRAADFVDGECSLEELPQLFRSMAAGNKAVKTLINVR
ncbi:MAG TPA: alcohol dehydrogenase catalytic domain-containing protein [Methylomirabilota bacterium]|nr:alcohol dehydrogenase catalytic domain-containing protein [Methylomirabilota bacterium]